jgi:hypothetical protein
MSHPLYDSIVARCMCSRRRLLGADTSMKDRIAVFPDNGALECDLCGSMGSMASRCTLFKLALLANLSVGLEVAGDIISGDGRLGGSSTGKVPALLQARCMLSGSTCGSPINSVFVTRPETCPPGHRRCMVLRDRISSG